MVNIHQLILVNREIATNFLLLAITIWDKVCLLLRGDRLCPCITPPVKKLAVFRERFPSNDLTGQAP